MEMAALINTPEKDRADHRQRSARCRAGIGSVPGEDGVHPGRRTTQYMESAEISAVQLMSAQQFFRRHALFAGQL
jgi:hypothetical protein